MATPATSQARLLQRAFIERFVAVTLLSFGALWLFAARGGDAAAAFFGLFASLGASATCGAIVLRTAGSSTRALMITVLISFAMRMAFLGVAALLAVLFERSVLVACAFFLGFFALCRANEVFFIFHQNQGDASRAAPPPAPSTPIEEQQP